MRADADVERNPYRWIILVGLILAAVMEVLDTTIVNVSLPQMAGNLGCTSEEIGWVSTGYILSNVVVLPLTAWLASRFGRRNYLGASILIFVGASFLCGTSTSLGSLVLWRIVQGAGGAALLSTAQATLREIFPREQQGVVQAIYVLGIIVAPTLGPTVGGWITDNYSWHWNFLINLPIGLLAFFLVYTFLQDSRFKMQSTKVDWLGIVLLATGLSCLQYVLEEGNAKGWLESPTLVYLLAVALFALPIFVWWELHPKNDMPVVNLRVLKNRDLAAALALFIALGFGLYGGVFIYPMFAQNVMHLTPTETGLTLLPGGIATGAAAMFCGRMLGGARRLFDPRIAIVVGLSLYIFSMVSLSGLPPTAGSADVQSALLIRGLGLGLLFVPINLSAFSSLKGAEIAQGAGMLNLCRQLGGSFGIAALGSYVTHQVHSSRSDLVVHVYAGNPLLQSRIAATAHALSMRGFHGDATLAATSLVDRAVNLQSAALAYNAGFLMIVAVSAISAPAVLALRKPPAIVAPPTADH